MCIYIYVYQTLYMYLTIEFKRRGLIERSASICAKCSLNSGMPSVPSQCPTWKYQIHVNAVSLCSSSA